MPYQDGKSNQPFWGRYDFDNARPHAVFVNLGNKLFEVAELPHGLESRVSNSYNLIGAMLRITSIMRSISAEPPPPTSSKDHSPA
jgi:hypothetical protein